jgi:hypothetical protein
MNPVDKVLVVASVGFKEVAVMARAGPGSARACDHTLVNLSPTEQRSTGLELAILQGFEPNSLHRILIQPNDHK